MKVPRSGGAPKAFLRFFSLCSLCPPCEPCFSRYVKKRVAPSQKERALTPRSALFPFYTAMTTRANNRTVDSDLVS